MIDCGRSRVAAPTHEIWGLLLFSSVGNYWMDNLKPDGALKWKVKGHRLGRSGSVMWQIGTSKVVASSCVG
jgi:hypothetical protein